eukprot:8582581-Pyramimonas_sp.AAC.1
MGDDIARRHCSALSQALKAMCHRSIDETRNATSEADDGDGGGAGGGGARLRPAACADCGGQALYQHQVAPGGAPRELLNKIVCD